MNKIILYGRLTRDPEIRFAQGSTDPIANITIAVNRKSANRETDFFNCSAFGKTAQLLQSYFKKGNRIGVSGNIQLRNWTDANGVKRMSPTVYVEELEFIETKQESDMQAQNSNNGYTQPSEVFDTSAQVSDLGATDFTVDSENDLPF